MMCLPRYIICDVVSEGQHIPLRNAYLGDSTPAKLLRIQVSMIPSTPRASFFVRADRSDCLTYRQHIGVNTTRVMTKILTFRINRQS